MAWWCCRSFACSKHPQRAVMTAFRSRFPVAVDKSGDSTDSCYLATYSSAKSGTMSGGREEGEDKQKKCWDLTVFLPHLGDALSTWLLGLCSTVQLDSGVSNCVRTATALSLSTRSYHKAQRQQAKLELLSFQCPRVHYPLDYGSKFLHLSAVIFSCPQAFD